MTEVDGGIYIHVPFCRSRCIYCDFYSTTLGEEWKSQYVSALLQEMSLRKDEVSFARASTLYIGGGTPSQLPVSELQRLLAGIQQCYGLEADAEVTVEANPDDVTPAWLAGLQATPVNRISMGVQSLDDDMLRLLHRRHSATGARDAIALCREFGYTNLSIDLIYGLPGQTMDAWKRDVEAALQLNVPHLSCYSLQVEEGTPLMKMVQEGRAEEADEELSLAMYEYLMDTLAAAGYEHYEISNFCKPGWHSRHNSSYWQQRPYLGLGPGAHSYDGKRTRRWNLSDVKAYVAAQGNAPYESEILSDDERYDELVMTRLRTRQGLPLSLLSPKRKDYCLRMAEPYLKSGKMMLDGDFLRLTKSSIFISDALMSDLMC